MKDSQLSTQVEMSRYKYIKANNERFSTGSEVHEWVQLSISRRIMKDSQLTKAISDGVGKYIKANNERFSTRSVASAGHKNSKQLLKDS